MIWLSLFFHLSTAIRSGSLRSRSLRDASDEREERRDTNGIKERYTSLISLVFHRSYFYSLSYGLRVT